MYDTYKHVKKLFRKVSRQCFNNTANQHHNKLNAFLTRRKMSAFWNEVKRQRRTKVKSSLKPEDFNKFYGNIMMDLTGVIGRMNNHRIKFKLRRTTISLRTSQMTIRLVLNRSVICWIIYIVVNPLEWME